MLSEQTQTMAKNGNFKNSKKKKSRGMAQGKQQLKFEWTLTNRF